MGDIEKVGKITRRVIDEFGLEIEEGQAILCGEGNREHMKTRHPKDYEKYGDKIGIILDNPTYIAKHPKKDSIEYIKLFPTEDGEHVLVAVRATGKGILFARTLFVMSPIKVEKYKNKNVLIEY